MDQESVRSGPVYGVYLHRDVRWVEDGNIFTSAGISAGIDMSLHLVKTLHSKALSEKTARQMEYASR